MKLSDYLADFLVQADIRHVFQIIGGASVHMVQSVAETKGIDYVCMQHEQAAAMAAESYARMTKNVGVAMATSGPGMTNLITGIGCAYFDSTPIICITGQVNTNESRMGRAVRQVGFQETDIVEMVGPLTKFAVRINDPADIRYLLEKALHIATSGRPGPVLLDVPMNISRAEIDPDTLRTYHPETIDCTMDTADELRAKVQQATSFLLSASRPVIIAGGAVRYADQADVFRKLVDYFSAPVVATWSGIDVLPHDHPLYCGQIGVYGNRAANFTVQNSDCILALGTRIDTRITGGKPETFARAAKKIVADIDRAELYKHRGFEPDIGLCTDIRVTLPLLLASLKSSRRPSITPWIKKTAEWKKRYPSVLPQWRKRQELVDPYVFVEALSQGAAEDAIVITDCGANLTWTIQAFHVRGRQRLFSAMGNSPMGYSLSASIGASIALGKREVICITGDGGLQINIQELQTLAHYLPQVKVFILNNHSYGIIKQFQELYFGGKYIGTTPESGYGVPDFRKIATAYGLPSETIANHQEMKKKIAKVLSHRGPIICDVLVPDDAKLIPKLEFGKPIEDLSPLLSRQEFKGNMLIPMI